MKFGIMLPHYRQVGNPDAISRVARQAEQMGDDSIWTSDHIVVPNEAVDRFGEVFYDPLTVLAHVSALTSTIRLGTIHHRPSAGG